MKGNRKALLDSLSRLILLIHIIHVQEDASTEFSIESLALPLACKKS